MAVLAYWIARTVNRPETFFVVALTASSGVAIMAAAWTLRNKIESIRDWIYGDGAWWNWHAAGKFFTISGLMFASGLFSSWAMTIVRARVLRTEGLAIGGELDAAWTISMNQAGLVLASLQTFYLPALVRISEPQQRSAHIARVLTIATISATALISLLIASKLLVLTTLYSEAFTGATRFLRWTLAGGLLKDHELDFVHSPDRFGAHAIVFRRRRGGLFRIRYGRVRPLQLDGTSRIDVDCIRSYVRGASLILRCMPLAAGRVSPERADSFSMVRRLRNGRRLFRGILETGMSKPTVSVAIATYNRAAMVSQAIDAACSQNAAAHRSMRR